LVNILDIVSLVNIILDWFKLINSID
jgi:hypothetical protein